MDPLQEADERAIGDKFIAWWNSTHRKEFRFQARAGPGEAPDLTYSDGASLLRLEVARCYYDHTNAMFKWQNARGLPDAPSMISGVNLTDKLIAHLNVVLEDKCDKRYGHDCLLVLHVAPEASELEWFQAKLIGVRVPASNPFAGIYLTGAFGVSGRSSGGFRCWRLDPLA